MYGRFPAHVQQGFNCKCAGGTLVGFVGRVSGGAEQYRTDSGSERQAPPNIAHYDSANCFASSSVDPVMMGTPGLSVVGDNDRVTYCESARG